MLKRLISFTTAVIMLLLCVPCTFALSTPEVPRSVEEILEDYHSRIASLPQPSDGIATYAAINNQADVIKQETIAELEKNGYEAYDVNPNSYDEVEANLKTDLSVMGVDANESYIIVLSSDPEEDSVSANTLATPLYNVLGPSFQFTYNGRTHIMRYVTITQANNPSYGSASCSQDLLKSSTGEVIERVLNTAINFAVDYAANGFPVSTVASLLGVQWVDINAAQQATLVLSYSCTYTKFFTQVYDSSLGLWGSCSSATKADILTHFSGQYYDKNTQAYQIVDPNQVRESMHSKHYYDYTWLKSNAAAAWWYGMTRNEYLGDVKYYYQGKLMNTFPEPHVGPAWS